MQSVNDTKQFIITFKQRCKDIIYTQTCLSEIEASIRCRLNRNINEVHDTKFSLRELFTVQLSSSVGPK